MWYNIIKEGVLLGKFIDRTGEIGYNNQGEKMTIIRCRGCEDIDIEFEDGIIVYNKDYNNFKNGRIKHPIRYEESFAYYIEVELNLDINDIWNWEKNNENKINPYEITKNSHKKVLLYCQKKHYHNYDKKGNKVGYETTCANFYNGKRCGYCGSHKTHYKDSLAYNYPETAKMIAIERNNLTFDDCYNIASFSHKNFYFKCNKCEMVSDKKHKLSDIIKYGYSCKFCSDGISIPNKFMSNLLNKINVNFKSEYSPYYFRNKQAIDFLLIDYNIIIEMDGNYGNHTIEYDYWRDFLNMKYGGYKTIRIDLTDGYKYRKDLFNYIKEQIINSELFKLFDLSNINYELISKQCQNSKCIEAWELWNNGMHDTKEISNILDLSRTTIISYLKRGVECNKCNYIK